MASSYDAPTDDEGQVEGTAGTPASKKIKSQPPDIVVAVGSGETMQEFKCYKVILSFASEYLDTMLSSNMKEEVQGRIEFPNKDPDEWRLLYDIISPQNIGLQGHGAKINKENVLTLLPWFHEFQMSNHVKHCDQLIASEYAETNTLCWQQRRWGYESEDERKSKFGMILSVMQASCKYNLKSAKDVTEGKIATLMNDPRCEDLFDFSTVKYLLLLVLPLTLDIDSGGLKMREGSKSKHLWPIFEKILEPHLTSLSQEVIDNEAVFPVIFYGFMRLQAESKRLKSAKRIVECFVHKAPKYLYENITNKAGAKARDGLIRYMREKLSQSSFDCIGIDVP